MDVIGGCWLVVVERGAGGRRTRGTDTALKTTFNNPTRQCGEQSLYRLTLVILSLDSNIRTSKACRSEYEPHQQEGYTISIYIYVCFEHLQFHHKSLAIGAVGTIAGRKLITDKIQWTTQSMYFSLLECPLLH